MRFSQLVFKVIRQKLYCVGLVGDLPLEGMQTLLFLLACVPLVSWSASVVIPDIQNPKHEIGFVCLKEIQGGYGYDGQPSGTCGPPFRKFKNGNRLAEEYAVPTWAKKSNGVILSREEWEKIPAVMTGYEENYGFTVWNSRKDAVELRLENEGKNESVWIAKDKIEAFYPLKELGFCGIGGEKWWNQLYNADLKTKSDVDLSKAIPGDPFRGLDPAGILEVKLNLKTQICSGLDSCVAAKVAVDPKLFKQDAIVGARNGKVTSLNLAFEHFKGESVGFGQPIRTDYLLVMDRKGDNEYLLQSVIYDEPQVWVKIPQNLRAGVKFLPATDLQAVKVLKGEKFQLQSYSQAFLQEASFTREGEKWLDGQFWIKAKVHFVNACTDPELSEKKSLGEYWIPYSKNIRTCPKGC